MQDCIIELVACRNIDVDGIEFQQAHMLSNDRNEKGNGVTIVRCLIVPPMKSNFANANTDDLSKKHKVCIVHLAFENGTSEDKQSQATLIRFPCSCCGCPDGRGDCSHQISAL